MAPSEGPWVLVASASGLGKRVPVNQFRLQKRAGMGLRCMKFRRDGDALVGLKVLGAGEELLLVSERGVIVRMQSNAVPQQSRAATGVRLQRLDAGDHLAEVVLVPPAAAEPESDADGADAEGSLRPDVPATSSAAGELPAPSSSATTMEQGSAEPDDEG